MWLAVLSGALSLTVHAQEIPRIHRQLDVAEVWAGHPVGFCLLTTDSRQYVGYYGESRRMTVAMRTLDSTEWTTRKLPEAVGWDSHNYITMAVDEQGFIHLSGNMHGDPLVYFRTTEPRDVSTFARLDRMVGAEEQRCTYPQFIHGSRGELFFLYRDGSSGDGAHLVNRYDVKTKTWRRLLGVPLFDGLGKVNAYPEGPFVGPDGGLHFAWVWRDHGGCETNHDLCHAWTKDMVHWQTAAGRPITLPITPNTKGTIVDPVPARGGMINETTVVGFDSQDRAIVSYHKFDANGHTQAYNARWEQDRWKLYQTSDWGYRWYFSGGGCIINEVDVGPITSAAAPSRQYGSLIQPYYHVKHGQGIWKLDEETLKPIASLKAGPGLLGDVAQVKSRFPQMQVRWQRDSGGRPDTLDRYFLRWETLPINRDSPYERIPPASILRLYRIGAADWFDPRMSCIHDGFF